MRNQNFVRVNNSLFVMAIMFSSGIYFGSVYDKIINFFSEKLTHISGENLLYTFWFLVACLSLMFSILGVYSFLTKGKVKNFFIYTYLILYSVEIYLFGNKLAWVYGGLDFPLVWNNATKFGFGINYWGIYLFFWYLIIVRREKSINSKQPFIA